MFSRSASTFLKLAIAIFVSQAATQEASASIIDIDGSTAGSFTTSVTNLTFAGRDFSWKTDEAGNANVVLGTFTNNRSYASNKVFNLTVEFETPDGLQPLSATFTASVSSSWNGFFGNVDIFFNNTKPIHFTYENDEGIGSFDLAIKGTQNANYPGFFNMGGTGSRDITAVVTNARFEPVPEPATMSLLALGGLALLRRRRTA